jgi:hypothetical protein
MLSRRHYSSSTISVDSRPQEGVQRHECDRDTLCSDERQLCLTLLSVLRVIIGLIHSSAFLTTSSHTFTLLGPSSL